MTCCWDLLLNCSASVTFRVTDLSWVTVFQITAPTLCFPLPVFWIRSVKYLCRFYASSCLWEKIFWLNGHSSAVNNVANPFYPILSTIILCSFLGHCRKQWLMLRTVPVTELSWSSPLKKLFYNVNTPVPTTFLRWLSVTLHLIY